VRQLRFIGAVPVLDMGGFDEDYSSTWKMWISFFLRGWRGIVASMYRSIHDPSCRLNHDWQTT
jgi:hypothetical protein